ncbi:alpha-1,6-mannosyltransferase/alpha-1,6-mannosyltransferase [Nocardioides szechwanensis]|uniref:Alpha-1,6-mannosyltransferase/alpha-1,6-mannosyltransferase n=1 Tax=Nocardioides szechwanensis TaxID=1005944 RepID=A0A1G9Z1K4_9ACTN|nr:alpha-1,6-mannosyltransferase/alpha-1,6-mannosyltransferase [Nocardioides szechwanensis]
MGSVLVLLGGLVVSTLPPSAPLLETELLLDLRGAEAGRMAGLTVVLLGLGLLAGQWLSLCRHVALAEGDDRDDALALVRHATVVWCAPLVLAPPLFSRDGWSYAAQGMLAHLGISPYEHGPIALHGPIVEAVDQRWMETITPYGPVPLLFGDLAATQTGNPWVLVVGHRLVALVGLVLLAWAIPRLARWTGVNPALSCAVVLASPLMLANGVGGLHNDLLMVGLMAAALVVGVEQSWWLGAAVGGAAAAVKVPGGLVCIAIALASLPAGALLAARVRRLAGAAVVSVGALVGLGIVTGLGVGWVHGLTVPGSVNTPLSVTTLLGGAGDWLAGWAGLGLEPATVLRLVRALGSVATVVVILAVALRGPTGSGARALTALATMTGATMLLGPVVHLWYLLWVVPFVAVLKLSRLAMMGVLALSTVTGLLAPLDSSLHGAYLAIALASMLVACLVPVLLLTPRARMRIERIVTAEWLPPVSGRQPQQPARDLDVHVEHPVDRA